MWVVALAAFASEQSHVIDLYYAAASCESSSLREPEVSVSFDKPTQAEKRYAQQGAGSASRLPDKL